MSTNLKSPNTLQTSQTKGNQKDAKNGAFLDDSIESIEKFRDL